MRGRVHQGMSGSVRAAGTGGYRRHRATSAREPARRAHSGPRRACRSARAEGVRSACVAGPPRGWMVPCRPPGLMPSATPSDEHPRTASAHDEHAALREPVAGVCRGARVAVRQGRWRFVASCQGVRGGLLGGAHVSPREMDAQQHPPPTPPFGPAPSRTFDEPLPPVIESDSHPPVDHRQSRTYGSRERAT